MFLRSYTRGSRWLRSHLAAVLCVCCECNAPYNFVYGVSVCGNDTQRSRNTTTVRPHPQTRIPNAINVNSHYVPPASETATGSKSQPSNSESDDESKQAKKEPSMPSVSESGAGAGASGVSGGSGDGRGSSGGSESTSVEYYSESEDDTGASARVASDVESGTYADSYYSS